MEYLLIKDLRIGDILEWDSSSAVSGKRTGRVQACGVDWINVGRVWTPRNQDWLDNKRINVRRVRQAD